MLDEATVARLAEVAGEKDLLVLRVRLGDSEVVISRGGAPAVAPAARAPAPAAPAPASAAPPVPAAGAARHLVTAPMIGTFYRSPARGEEPFVQVGTGVEAGETVGLIEAMKVFTAVKADVAGSVSEILVADASFVEFGQALMALDPTGPAPA